MRGDDIASLIESARSDGEKAIALARTSEFENWVVRIVLGGGGLRVRSVQKAIETKYHTYVREHKGDPAKQVWGPLWLLAKPLIGSGK